MRMYVRYLAYVGQCLLCGDFYCHSGPHVRTNVLLSSREEYLTVPPPLSDYASFVVYFSILSVDLWR